jgi:ABC-type multidrug transport system permease subunit
MLLYHLDVVCKATLFIPVIILLCVAYTYSANLRRKSDDPKKRDYHPFAILLAPITLPLFLFSGIFLFMLWALIYGLFLVVFAVLLVAIRKPFLFQWWHKFATAIGDPLLKANTRLIRMAFEPLSA